MHLRGRHRRQQRVIVIHVHGRRKRGRVGRRRAHVAVGRGDVGTRPQRHRRTAIERIAQLVDALRPVDRTDRQGPIDRFEERRREARVIGRPQQRHVDLHRTRGRRRWRRAADQVVDDGAQRVQIGPRALAQLHDLGVLLDRRVARLQDRGEGVRVIADDAARGAEVEQHRRLARRQQDVVGRDVAVIDALAMQQVERFENRVHHAAHPCLGRRLGHAASHIARGVAEQVRHHHVGGAVGFPEVIDLHQRRMIEAGQQPRFVDERSQAHRIRFGIGRRSHRHHLALAARRERARHVFLQRHRALQRMVLREVDDAEAADPDHPQDLELAEARSGRQRVALVDRGRRVAGRRRRRIGDHDNGGTYGCIAQARVPAPASLPLVFGTWRAAVAPAAQVKGNSRDGFAFRLQRAR